MFFGPSYLAKINVACHFIVSRTGSEAWWEGSFSHFTHKNPACWVGRLEAWGRLPNYPQETEVQSLRIQTSHSDGELTIGISYRAYHLRLSQPSRSSTVAVGPSSVVHSATLHLPRKTRNHANSLYKTMPPICLMCDP